MQKKKYYKSQHKFVIKSLTNIGPGGNLFNLIIGNYVKLKASYLMVKCETLLGNYEVPE